MLKPEFLKKNHIWYLNRFKLTLVRKTTRLQSNFTRFCVEIITNSCIFQKNAFFEYREYMNQFPKSMTYLFLCVDKSFEKLFSWKFSSVHLELLYTFPTPYHVCKIFSMSQCHSLISFRFWRFCFHFEFCRDFGLILVGSRPNNPSRASRIFKKILFFEQKFPWKILRTGPTKLCRFSRILSILKSDKVR